MASGFACYHHCNDLDRPSVATCNKCGKALCAQCTDTFRSRKNNKILCIECLNGEIASNEALFARVSARRKKEMTMMIVGAIIGLILCFALFAAIGPFALLVPFVFASLGTIWEKSFGTFGWLVGIILFIVMAVISPIMFVVRLLSRIKERKTLAEAIAYNQRLRQANNSFLNDARKKKSGLTGAELQRISMQMQNAQMQLLTMTSQMDQARRELDQAKASGNTALVAELEKRVADIASNQQKLQSENAALQDRITADEENMKKQEEESRAQAAQMKEVLAQKDEMQLTLDAMTGTKKKKA